MLSRRGRAATPEKRTGRPRKRRQGIGDWRRGRQPAVSAALRRRGRAAARIIARDIALVPGARSCRSGGPTAGGLGGAVGAVDCRSPTAPPDRTH